MVDRDLLAAKLSELADRAGRVRRHCPPTAAELGRDRDRLDLVSFNLMLAVQVCLDVASHLIADEGWPAAADLAGSFARLREQDVISPATAEALARAAGLRNVVAHVYGRVDAALVFRAATDGLADLERFAAEVAAWAEAQPQQETGR
ncbi:MAG TPA: DUF86 domain-containing protein [Thermoanaerobaculia bacterium]|nr:DUF86 domain-containing protein [Thermoanaerobaculia bacterium]